MNENWQHITHSGQCPSIDKLELYYKGKLSKEENFAIENHLASCEICNDLLEGLSGLKDINSLGKIENELNQQLREKLFRKKSKQRILPVYQRLAVAASILIIIGIAIFIYFNNIAPVKKIAQSLPKSSSPAIEKSEPKQEVKEEPLNKFKGTVRKRINVPVKEKEKNNALSMSEIQFEEGSGTKENLKTSQIRTVDTVMVNSPMAVVSDKAVLVTENDDAKREKPEFKKENGTKIEYDRSLISGNNVINGRVADEKGEPMPGVNIVIKGTQKGVVTDLDGRFKITLDTPQDVLNISYVGYKSQELTAMNEADVKITLEPDVVALNEVVVVGYGVQKKKMVTASTSAVGINEMSVHETEKRKILISEIDSLNNVLNTDKQNTQALKEIIEKYLELNNKNETLAKLNELYTQTNEAELKKSISEIIKLVNNEKYSKALKKLKILN